MTDHEIRIERFRRKKEDKLKRSLKTENTLLYHIEQVIELVENSELYDFFFEIAKDNLDFIVKKLNLNHNQAVLFSIFIEKSNDNSIFLEDISRMIGCRMVKVISMINDFDELERRQLIRCKKSDDRPSYRVPVEVVEAIKQNIVYKPKSISKLNTSQLFEHLDLLFKAKDDNEISYSKLDEDIHTLLQENKQLHFCQQLEANKKKHGGHNNLILLIFFCHKFVNYDDDSINTYEWEKLFDDNWTYRSMKMGLQRGDNNLICNNYFEYHNDNGFEDKEKIKLTDWTKESLFPELDITLQQTISKQGLIQHEDIVTKKLFFNQKEQRQIEQLSDLLLQNNFLSVQKRLQESGVRKGFACLFHGAPGTGKTETAYQIARITGRNVMLVDIAESKSKWYGESEKKIKKIFDTYRNYMKVSEVAPILLFNEADAIIGKRKEVGQSSMTQTENSIQNILLQEMENLDGIMIATTNLTENMDKAFERRFLYKIEFKKPCIEAKSKIWNAMLPSLTEKESRQLASSYNLSGGQIENIVRKCTVDSILTNTTPNVKTIDGYCQDEFMQKSSRKRIGFC